jgi:exonuclease SbcC
MRPLALTLKGFRGIRDGLRRDEIAFDLEKLVGDAQLVALAGMNGRGKTTLIDCLHPYLVMPSRASVPGPGGFSYYEHVCLPENEKDLVWAHEGRRYRSHVVIRLNGRRRTEAFLFAWDESGWKPFAMADGTVSDGRVETYERCVEAICGSAQTFFTSAFSAQGKRQLSSYKNAEIKTLLADLLGLEEIRALGHKASETAKLLKAGLTSVRQEQAELEEEARRTESERTRLASAQERIKQAETDKAAAQRALDAARTTHAKLAAEREHAQATESRRAELRVERKAVIDAGRQAIAAFEAQERREQQRLERLNQRIAMRTEQSKARRRLLETKRSELLGVLAFADGVARADRRRVLAERMVAARAARVEQLRANAQRLAQFQGDEKAVLQRVAAIEREAGQVALNAAELTRRFGLTNEVPCAGSDLQGRCKLLGDAREAKTLMPSADLQIAHLAQQQLAVNAEVVAIRGHLQALADAPGELRFGEYRLEQARERAARITVLAAKAGEVAQARAAVTGTDQDLAALSQSAAECETPDEAAERRQIKAAREDNAAERERQAGQSRSALDRIDRAIAALPAGCDDQRFVQAGRAVEQAGEALASAERSYAAASRDAQALDMTNRQLAMLRARKARVMERATNIEAELAQWLLLAKCLSNDGVIALAIDDAGPALSALANDLLLACYGARFSVSIRTLVETGKAEQREGFDIVVHDAESGDSKSVSLMSGGERVWINECLVRAIALYLTQHSGRRYVTLFSDEADGALDPERKRMFMQMKREVLRLGGYQQEFFVSQTPELTVMADAVIDLDAMAIQTELEDAA